MLAIRRHLRNAVVDSPPVLLGDTILAAAASSVSFVVPKGYDILIFMWHHAKGDNVAPQALRLTFNGDGAGNYDHSRRAFNLASDTTNGAAFILFDFVGETAAADWIANGFVTIFNRAAQEKVVIGTVDNIKTVGVDAHDAFGRHIEAKWRNTSDEIILVTITASVGNIIAASRFTILGISTKGGN